MLSALQQYVEEYRRAGLPAVREAVAHEAETYGGYPEGEGAGLRYRLRNLWQRRRLVALPVLGPILRKIILSRFASVFAMMYASGIAIIDAIRATEDVVGNTVIEGGLKHAGQLIAEGQNVTVAFQNINLFPPLVIRMLKVGENTGALDSALLNVAYFYNRDVKESIERVQAMIEPTMTMVVGIILGWIMLAVLGPIYDVITKLKT